MGLFPGALVGTNVRLVRPLSRGGMGSVWRAEHLTLHTEVAVKFVSDALIGDAGFLARFQREAVASARIKSPHAVQTFDHGVTADGLPYIVMELLEGEDLRTRLAREKKLSVETTGHIVAQVARGLARSHAQGVVHRDIKPGNIFLQDHEGELFIKILDFGIAKRMGDLEQAVTMTGQIIGTPHYVSPEQIQKPRDADPQNDLWSLAVVAYKCLTGELPFEGENVGAVSIAIDKAAFIAVTAREASLPKMLDVWFGRAFSRAPSARFGSAKEMAAAFEAAAKDEPLPSVPPESVSITSTPSGARAEGGAESGAESARDGAGEAETAVAREDARATRPDAERPSNAAAVPTVTGSAQPADTPLSAGEPTLSQGTVTHIEAGNPRRTKLYGALIAAVAIVGALTVGLLSRGDDGKTAGTAASATGALTATAEASATNVSATTAVEVVPTATPANADVAPDGPATSATAPASQGKAAPAPSTPKKKKKERGF